MDLLLSLVALLVAAFLALMPYSALTVAGLWLVGFAQRRAYRSNVARGGRVLWRLVVPRGWVAERRRRHQRPLLVAGLVVCMAVIVGSLWTSTAERTPWLIGLCVAVVAAAGWWAWSHGAADFDSLGDWAQERRLRQQVEHAARQVVPDAAVFDASALPGHVEATITIPPGANPDVSAAQLGTALEGALRSSFGHVEITPIRGSQSRLRLNVAVDPLPDPWELLSKVDTTWPGPSSTVATDRVRIGWGVAPDGRTIIPTTIPNPCVGAEYVFVTGMPRTGKTGTMQTIIAEMAFREHVALELLDPEMVEFQRWAPRAHVSLGVAACVERIVEIHDHLEARRLTLARQGMRHWVPEMHGPLLLIVVDELASLWSEPVNYRDTFGITVEKLRGLLIGFGQRGAKLGVGLVSGTQRGDFDVIPTRLRDIHPTKIAHRTGSLDGARMALSDDDKALWPAVQSIPRGERFRGCSIVVADADENGPRHVCNRACVPQAAGQINSHEAISVAVERIATATAALKPGSLIYQQEAT